MSERPLIPLSKNQLLLANFIGHSKIDSLSQEMQGSGSRLQNSGAFGQDIDPVTERSFKILAQKTLGVTDGLENIPTDQITAMGGWCAVRTADMNNLNQGELVEPTTGEVQQYTSVEEVAGWVKDAVAMDQIIEAIAPYDGKNYTAISEEQLWSEKLRKTISARLKRPLSTEEGRLLDQSLATAEKRRFECTQNYLNYVTGNANLTQVKDGDIQEGLIIDVRGQLLDAAGITLSELMEQFPEDKNIEEYSIVWGMYTGPYLQLLQNKGYVQTPKGVLVEPQIHSVSETQSKAYVNDQIFGNPNNAYLAPGGMNKNLGFVTFADTMTAEGKRLRQAIPIGKVPNQMNYEQFIASLETAFAEGKCSTVTLKDNPAFIWGTNLYPYGSAQEALIRIVQIKDEFQAEKEIINSKPWSDARTQEVKSLKQEFGQRIGAETSVVIQEVSKMLRHVFR